MIRVAVATFAGAFVVGVQSGTAALESAFAESGRVLAQIVYSVQPGKETYAVRLTVRRDGRKVLHERVRPLRGLYGTKPEPIRGARPIAVRDLDGDGELEILLDLYSGGAHCCFWSRIYTWSAVTGRYRSSGQLWGNVAYRLADVDRDRNEEFVSADDRFAYAFTSYAASSDPLQIWTYRSGRLVDTTRAFSELIARDTSRQWRMFLEARQGHDDVRGYLGAWVADECLLGRGAAAFQTLRGLPTAVWRSFSVPQVRSARAYLSHLSRFLKRIGYAC